MTDLSDAALEAMAGSLTAAQKKAFKAGYSSSIATARVLLKAGLFGMFRHGTGSRFYWLSEETPLGLALRNFLQSKDTRR